MSTRRGGGFTLVELLLVVIILSVLAGIMVSIVGDSSDDSRQAALVGNLASMRKAIDVYTLEHGAYPGQTSAKPGVSVCSVTAGKGTGLPDKKEVKKAFIEQLTLHTTPAGEACSVGGGPYSYGPYLRGDELPLNPLTGKNDLKVVDDGDLFMTGNTKSKGWKYDVLTGKLIADDENYDHL